MKINLKRLYQLSHFGNFSHFAMGTLVFVYCLAAYAEPTDEYVVELYETYCMACHSIEGTGAPMAFDANKWSQLAEQGTDQLLNNAISGVGNMPAQGGCMECGYQDFEDLIKYMSHQR